MATSIDANEQEINEVPTQIKPYPEYRATDSVRLKEIPQGSGSKLDSDTVDGLNASTYQAPRPNTLVPVGPQNTLPLSIFPGASGTFISADAKTITVENGIITSIV